MFKLLNIVLLVNLGLTNHLPYAYDINVGKVVLPRFINSDKFTTIWNEDKGLIELYKKLEKDGDYQIYNYSFEVSKDGKVIGKHWEGAKELLNIINYFRSTNWIPAYKRGCAECKERSFGMLEISIIPSKNLLKLRIDVGDGVLKKGLKTIDIYSETKKLGVHVENSN